jgi:hypothetical protein
MGFMYRFVNRSAYVYFSLKDSQATISKKNAFGSGRKMVILADKTI